MNAGSVGRLFLGIEGGGSRTVAIMADAEGKLVGRWEIGPANVRLLSDAQLIRQFRLIASDCGLVPSAIGIGLAGARTEEDRVRVSKAAAKVWPRVPVRVSHDLDTALLAASAQSPSSVGETLAISPTKVGVASRGRRHRPPPAPQQVRVLVLSGTGSCCYGRTPSGETAKVGGWGHLLGDKGSGYEIGLRGLKAAVYYYDRDGDWPVLGQRLLRVLQLNEPEDLIGWVQNASKQQIAELALEVFGAAEERDKIARDILEAAVHTLAKDAVACAKRLASRSELVEFVFAGSVLQKQPRFAKAVAREIKTLWPKCRVITLPREGAWGAVELAKMAIASVFLNGRAERAKLRRTATPTPTRTRTLIEIPKSSQLSPTEQRNARSMNLHRMNIAEAIALMLGEEERVPTAVLAERKKIERVIRWITHAFRVGGRLFYVGAGTSGRLGVLDASECPPTFRAPPEQIQGIIAGGQQALWRSIEGAEDDGDAGVRAVQFRGVNKRDVVIGIAASGRTPFVWGALAEAKRRGAQTVLVCFNPNLVPSRAARPGLIIAPDIGPEVLTGSTRLKAGTATKLLLNLFTTLSMVRSGKVISNLMVDVNPSNTKLRERAVRILQALTGLEPGAAKRALENAGWIIKDAWKNF